MVKMGCKMQFIFLFVFIITISRLCNANDILGCGGFVKSHVSLDYSKIEIGLYTKEGSLKEKTECAPTNGYYFLPLYEKGDYILKVHPPPGWSFEPSQVDLSVDGASDPCSTNQDVNFVFNGFGIAGRVLTAGQNQGPSGIAVQLINDKGDVRNAVTTKGGDFHFTPVIPGKYTVKAAHPRWKLEPAQAVVQVKEGNTALPVGVLAVKGYDVMGSITSFGSPITGVYVVLYSKEENPKFRVEGCTTALLQGVPGSPICHTITDASGEFTFGLVPAGEYKLLALSTSPGQTSITYNVKPETVSFTVRHDSLYIKNAFEVTGFTVVGSVHTSVGGKGMSGVRVLLDGKPEGTTDAAGKFTLPSLQPAVYSLSFQHAQCEFDDVQLTVQPTGPRGVPAARAARWRVCGAVTPPDARHVTLAGERPEHSRTVHVAGNEGKWCTYLPSGVYSAKVEVSEQEQRDGLVYYPVSQKVSVGNAPVDGVSFSQLKGTLSGRVVCPDADACADVTITLRPLSPDGGYVGQPLTTQAVDGAYEFSEVRPGSVEVSAARAQLCWAEAAHNVAVTQRLTAVPAFRLAGYVLRVHSDHDVEVEYVSGSSRGVLSVTRGTSSHCVSTRGPHTLIPRGCHRFNPAEVKAVVGSDPPQTVYLRAEAHSAVIVVTAPTAVTDLTLTIAADGQPADTVGPLVARPHPDGGFVFEHTLYMADGEVSSVTPASASLLFSPGGAQAVSGRADCQPAALTLRARAALTLAGALLPPVPGVTVTLAAEDGSLSLSQVTSADGAYRFGPLDAAQRYSVSAAKESYEFSAPDDSGRIVAKKLAEIVVTLLDDATGKPLPGAVVSVSGGTYRHVAAAAADGIVRFGSLSPAQYYVKPHVKEYRFTPPHATLAVLEGRTHPVTLRGVRVAWSCLGRLVSLGGAGWAGAALLAEPAPHAAPHCAPDHATTDADGAFRIRGLLPDCQYTIQLKESSNPELAGLKLAKAPPTIEIKDKKDIEGVRLIGHQPVQLTDGSVLVLARDPDHYRTLRLRLVSDAGNTVYTASIDGTGGPGGALHALPRLAADNQSYWLHLTSALKQHAHAHSPALSRHFVSDGRYKHFTLEFAPKLKSSEQELRQTSLLVIPLAALLAAAWWQRARLAAAAGSLAARALAPPARPPRRPDVLDKASIDHIVSTVNAAGKRQPKKKQL